MNETEVPSDLIGYNVVDTNGNNVGSVDSAWLEGESGALAFIGVKIGMILGKTHVIPSNYIELDPATRTIQVPFTSDEVAGAPTADPNDTLMPDQQDEIRAYYRSLQSQQAQPQVGAVPVPPPSSSGGQSTAASTTAPSGAGASPGSFPVDDVTYDLYSLITHKLEAMQVYDEYIQDAEDDADLANLIQTLRQQDYAAVQMLQQFLINRLGSQSS